MVTSFLHSFLHGLTDFIVGFLFFFFFFACFLGNTRPQVCMILVRVGKDMQVHRFSGETGRLFQWE